MGDRKHFAILVTGRLRDLIQAHRQAINLNLCVSPTIPGVINGIHSFFCAPDGSQVGWDTAEETALARDTLIDWLEKSQSEGHTCLQWAEVQYGDERDLCSKVRRSSDGMLLGDRETMGWRPEP